MSNEIKAVSFRLAEEDIQRFREFAEEQGMNQAEMFQSLVNNFELAKAKGAISDRAKEIETFQDTVNTLVGMFVNSLAVNQTSEERIRETLSLELNTKDKTIADLQGRLSDLKGKYDQAAKETADLLTQKGELQYELADLGKEIEQKSDVIRNFQSQITTLSSLVDEYKGYKELNKIYVSQNTDLKEQVAVLQHNNEDLQSKLRNVENMKDFYHSEVDNLKAENKEIRTNLKEIEIAHKQEIIDLENKHKAEIEKIRKDLELEFTNAMEEKISMERGKHEFELEKAAHREKVLQDKYDTLKANTAPKTTPKK